MKAWSVVFVAVITLFLLASCGKSGDASKVVSAPSAPAGSCQEFCQKEKPGDCAGKWTVEGVSPNCKCTWQCNEEAPPAAETSPASAVLSTICSEDKQICMQVDGNEIKDGAVEYVPSTKTTPGDELIVSGPILAEAKSVNIYKKGVKDKVFKLAMERPVETVKGEQVATAPLWLSDAGKTVTIEVVKLNGAVVSYKDKIQLTIIPKVS